MEAVKKRYSKMLAKKNKSIDEAYVKSLMGQLDKIKYLHPDEAKKI